MGCFSRDPPPSYLDARHEHTQKGVRLKISGGTADGSGSDQSAARVLVCPNALYFVHSAYPTASVEDPVGRQVG